jgi:cytochrome c-type biogenesis protein CcmF
MTGESPPVALGRLVRRNRRRYGGYIVHAGVAIALVGVAGSTSFQHSREATIGPGQSVKVDGYKVTYLRPTATASAEKISLGAWLGVARNGHRVATLHTSYGLYASQNALSPIGRFFDGASTESRVGLQSGLTKDIWTVIKPNIAPLGPLVARGDAVLGKALDDALKQPPAARQRALNLLYQARDIAIRGIAERFVTHPWKATFLLIVSPIVVWLWLGAIIAAFGGLIALWPLPPPRRRPPLPVSGGRDGEARVAPAPRSRELVAPMLAPPPEPS